MGVFSRREGKVVWKVEVIPKNASGLTEREGNLRLSRIRQFMYPNERPRSQNAHSVSSMQTLDQPHLFAILTRPLNFVAF